MIRAAAVLATACLGAAVLAPVAEAAPSCVGGVASEQQVSQVAVGDTRATVRRTLGTCGVRVWMHDERMQKSYNAEGGTGELRINYNLQDDGRWTLTNAFWMTPRGAGEIVVGS